MWSEKNRYRFDPLYYGRMINISYPAVWILVLSYADSQTQFRIRNTNVIQALRIQFM